MIKEISLTVLNIFYIINLLKLSWIRFNFPKQAFHMEENFKPLYVCIEESVLFRVSSASNTELTSRVLWKLNVNNTLTSRCMGHLTYRWKLVKPVANIDSYCWNNPIYYFNWSSLSDVSPVFRCSLTSFQSLIPFEKLSICRVLYSHQWINGGI